MLLMEFLCDYPVEGRYTVGMSMYDKYHCWAVMQYHENSHALPASARPDAGTADGSPGGQRLEHVPTKRGGWHSECTQLCVGGAGSLVPFFVQGQSATKSRGEEFFNLSPDSNYTVST